MGFGTAIRPSFVIVVPAGARQRIINWGDVLLKLYTIYAPPYHRDGTIPAEAQADTEHFDSRTTE